jgi:hypothetical protein
VHLTALLRLAHDIHIHLIPGLTEFFSGVICAANTRLILGPAALCKDSIERERPGPSYGPSPQRRFAALSLSLCGTDVVLFRGAVFRFDARDTFGQRLQGPVELQTDCTYTYLEIYNGTIYYDYCLLSPDFYYYVFSLSGYLRIT